MLDPAERKVDFEDKPQHDVIQSIMGSFGRYHIYLCALMFLPKFFIAFHHMAIIFLAPKVEYTCGSEANTCPCDQPNYNKTVFLNTIVMEWNLICDRKWLISFTQTIFQLGNLFGSIIFGMASDRYGRKNPLIVAVVLQAIMGSIAATANNYWLFTVYRLVLGASIGGTMVISFVVMIEFIGAEHRQVLSAAYQAPFNVGHMMLPAIAYFLNDYVSFQLALSLPSFILLIYFCVLPETPRWLLAMRKTDDAVKLLTHVAIRNRRPTDIIRREVEKYQVSVEKNHLKRGNICDLFRTPNLRKNILVMSFNWLTCSYCFYGVSQYVGQLSGNAFINVACSASVTLLGTIASIPLMKYFGRRSIVIVENYICVVCLLLLTILPDGVSTVICACIGVVSSFTVFIVVYLYCTEMFPTVIRNAALGFCSMTARIGAMIAPFVIDLQDHKTWLPPLVFAICPFIAGSLAFLLPETKGVILMTTIEEGEKFGKKVPK